MFRKEKLMLHSVSVSSAKGKAMPSKQTGVSAGQQVEVAKESSTAHKQSLSQLMCSTRERKGKTLDEMAEATGLAKSTLWEMENDYQIDPRLSTLQRVCWAYGFGISRIANHLVTVER